jgi:mannose/fructose-specific phosphotransferase system component IIA
MEEALTQWLPSVTRPGDTVFIYFSGHTGQYEDQSGDEPDGKDEFLVMHDSFGPNEVYAAKTVMENKQQALDAGLLSENEMRLCEQLADVGQAVREKTGDLSVLRDTTCVTDEMFAHWLQRLAGRQVVFICDSCNSAGFAEREQEATAAPTAAPDAESNDMMKNEIDRLQNLGQHDQALFCSAHVGQSAHERIDKSMGVMTYYIVELMNQSPKAVRMEETFDYCKTNVEKYYDEWNAEIEKAQQAGASPAEAGRVGAAPFLFNNCRLPIYFKP